jgi:hypothetical protein
MRDVAPEPGKKTVDDSMAESPLARKNQGLARALLRDLSPHHDAGVLGCRLPTTPVVVVGCRMKITISSDRIFRRCAS